MSVHGPSTTPLRLRRRTRAAALLMPHAHQAPLLPPLPLLFTGSSGGGRRALAALRCAGSSALRGRLRHLLGLLRGCLSRRWPLYRRGCCWPRRRLLGMPTRACPAAIAVVVCLAVFALCRLRRSRRSIVLRHVAVQRANVAVDVIAAPITILCARLGAASCRATLSRAGEGGGCPARAAPAGPRSVARAGARCGAGGTHFSRAFSSRHTSSASSAAGSAAACAACLPPLRGALCCCFVA